MTPPAISLFGHQNSIYLTLAAIFGAWGIVSDSNDALIASMLVSPFFVPIINMYLKNGRSTAIANNSAILVASVLYCIAIGVITAKIMKLENKPESKTMIKISSWRISSNESTIMAYIIPILCGVLIAVAYRNQNIVPMVGAGVAIMILPAFVNAGLYIGRGKGKDNKKKAWDSVLIGTINVVLAAISYFIAISTLRRFN